MTSGDLETKYRRIADDLREEIRSGRLAEGSAVPGENALMERYSVARMTARQAIAVLRDEGLVHVQRGRGTFVRSSSPSSVQGAVPVPAELLERLGVQHGMTEEELSHALTRTSLSLVHADDGWAVEYRVTLD